VRSVGLGCRQSFTHCDWVLLQVAWTLFPQLLVSRMEAIQVYAAKGLCTKVADFHARFPHRVCVIVVSRHPGPSRLDGFLPV
jgi:hypothetical protein